MDLLPLYIQCSTSTKRRCVVNAIHVRADYCLVVLRRGQLVGAPLPLLAQLIHQRGPEPTERCSSGKKMEE